MIMKQIRSSLDTAVSRSSRHVDRRPHGRDIEELERKKREWMIQQERERQHERLKKEKIEEYERKRKAQEELNKRKAREEELKTQRRSSRRSNDHRKSESPKDRRKEETQEPGSSKTSIMSQKFESSSNNERMFKGPEGTKIDITALRRIKVDIHRQITAAEITKELQRDIIDPEDVKVKRRHGEGAKPIFDREELKKPEVPAPEVEERRTVVALDDKKIERRQSSTRKRSATPTSPIKRPTSRRHIDDRDSRYESSRHTAERSTSHRSSKQEGEKDRSRSKEHRGRYRSDDARERHSTHRSSHHDVSRDQRDRRNRSHSRDKDSRRNDTHHRSSSDAISHRNRVDRSRDDSRERRYREDSSRETRMRMSHYTETIPVPMYYEGFRPRPIMIDPMMPIRGQIPIGRGGMPPMMRPMRPSYPPQYFPEMYRPPPHLNPRFTGMF